MRPRSWWGWLVLAHEWGEERERTPTYLWRGQQQQTKKILQFCGDGDACMHASQCWSQQPNVAATTTLTSKTRAKHSHSWLMGLESSCLGLDGARVFFFFSLFFCSLLLVLLLTSSNFEDYIPIATYHYDTFVCLFVCLCDMINKNSIYLSCTSRENSHRNQPLSITLVVVGRSTAVVLDTFIHRH